jgi:aspartate 1-decarboxylase
LFALWICSPPATASLVVCDELAWMENRMSVPESMHRSMLKSKIHRATVTEADLNYEGSVTLDRRLLDAADILPFEEVHIWNVTRGTRFRTYAMEGEADSGVVCINGAAAHLAHPGDLVIIATYVTLPDAEARMHRPRVVLLDGANRIRDAHYKEVPGPARR